MKYQLARQFRAGCCACLKGEAIAPEQTEAWTEGYEWAYRYLKPMVNEEVNRYIVKRGFKPFSTIEVMRKGVGECSKT